MAKENGYLISFDGAFEEDGSLVFFEPLHDIPFEIKRVFYIYDVPYNETRADHANIGSDFLLIAINGSIKIELDDGKSKSLFELNKKTQGLYVPKLTWMKTYDFFKDAVLLCLASENYHKESYINDYELFLKILEEQNEKSCNYRG